jgi:membrane protease YdiL (CAAX protease family)
MSPGRGAASVSQRWTVEARRAAPSVVLVALLGIAALISPIRPLLAAALVVAYVVSRGHPDRSTAFAAVLPAAAILAWGAFAQPIAAPGGAQCADLFAPPALWRFAEAVVGLLVLGILVVDRGAEPAELGLRMASRRVTVVAIVGLLVVTPIALVAGSILGGDLLGSSFFGTYALDLSQSAALAPALVFAISNAFAEELAYRGAMRVWLAPTLGVVAANLAQAIVFGLAHSGADFVGPVAPVAASMIGAGFVAGVIARRTNSLALVLAIHAAADIPIYFYWACRVA